MSHDDRYPGRVAAFRLPWWQVALIAAVALAIGIALAVVSAGVFLIALPVVVLAVIAKRLFGPRTGPRRPSRPNAGGPVIDGEYEVVAARRVRPDRSPWRR